VQVEFHLEKLIYTGHTPSPLPDDFNILRAHYPKVPVSPDTTGS
jgi:hypothetical protein